VKSWYEWAVDNRTSKPRRHLRIFCDGGMDAQWQTWLNEAIANWNNVDTGWALETVDELQYAELTVQHCPILPDKHGRTPAARLVTDTDERSGEVLGGTITTNSDLPWGRSGDGNYDPVLALKHELGHAMRLDHSEWGMIMDPILCAGDHSCEPNSDDREEASQASSSTRTQQERSSSGEEEHVIAGPAKMGLTGADFIAASMLSPQGLQLVPLEGVMTPDPLAVPDGMERVIVSVGVFPVALPFTHPARLSLKVSAESIGGHELAGENHQDLLLPLDPASMTPVAWRQLPGEEAGAWVILEGQFSLEDDGQTVSFAIVSGGLYGVAARAASGDRPEYRTAFADLTAAVSGPVCSALTGLNAIGVYLGYPDGTACPDRPLTRCEFFTLAVRAAQGDDVPGMAGQRPGFTDEVPEWAWGYINRAVDLGLARGYPDGTFGAQRDVTGNEALTVAVRLLGASEDSLAASAPWPGGYVLCSSELGLLDGLSSLLGDETEEWRERAITRGEMAVLLRAVLFCGVRHSLEGGLAACASLAAARGWWTAEVKVAAVSEDGRRWLLERPVGPDESSQRILRLDLPARVLFCPGCPAVEPGAGLTALCRDGHIVALLR
jgi:hypothetical protein